MNCKNYVDYSNEIMNEILNLSIETYKRSAILDFICKSDNNIITIADMLPSIDFLHKNSCKLLETLSKVNK